MRIIVVEDEPPLLVRLTEKIKAYIASSEVFAFSKTSEAIGFIDKNQIDIAFLDIQMGSMSGIEIAKRIKEKQPRCNIVFCTGYMEYAYDAFNLAASDYLTKPITAEKIKHALENLRYPPTINIPENKLFARCFGEFEVFLNGKPLQNLGSRAKEMFAFIIDKQGALCNVSEILSEVFTGLADANLRIARSNLETVLEEHGQSDILIRKWGKIGVDTEKLFCDFYEYMKGNPAAMNLYKGEYMHGYKWATYFK